MNCMAIGATGKISRVRGVVSVKVGVVGRGGWCRILMVKDDLTRKKTFDQCCGLNVCVPAQFRMLKPKSSR